MNLREIRYRLSEARRRHPLSATAQALFWELIGLFEEAGFPEEKRIRNGEFYSTLDITDKTLEKARAQLMATGLIFYTSEKAKKLGGTYSLAQVLVYSGNNPVQTPERAVYLGNNPVKNPAYPVKNPTEKIYTGNNPVQSAQNPVYLGNSPDNILYTTTNKESNSISSKEEIVESRLSTPSSGFDLEEGGKGEKEAAGTPPFGTVKQDMPSLFAYIAKYRPKAAEPYFGLWNLFAAKYGLPKLQCLTAERRRKLRARLAEKEFDFLGILTAVSKSRFLLENKVCTFDWLTKNDKNYLKVLEGNYNNTHPQKQNHGTNQQQQELSGPAAELAARLQQRSNAAA